MGAIDDTRKPLQDLITPDLKALEARVVALEQKMDLRFDHLDKKVDLKSVALDKKIDLKIDALDKKIETKIDSLDKKIDLKFETLSSTMAANQIALMHYLDVDLRLRKLESEKNSPSDRPS